MLQHALPLLAATIFAGPGPSEPGSPAGADYDGSAGHLDVAAPAVDAANIRVDGRLDDAAWELAALLHGFTQFMPVEGGPASQRTEVLLLVDADAIYFGVRAYDDDPAAIRATLSERDAFDRSDDWVRILLDTFDDQRRAYVFTVNPLGVQHDGLWAEGGGGGGPGARIMGPPIDANPDFLWESDAHIRDWGYEIELRIPFKSLRFPDSGQQSWGLHVVRRIQRSGFTESWAPMTNDVSNRLTQAGKLSGLTDLDMGLFMEINPVLTGSRFGAYDAASNELIHADPSADFGLNATYGVTSNLTLDATFNPDFSQVEADAGQISVNERFAIFFPEKRPFFLEGTEIFQMPRQLIYTRSVANPIGGAKLTGQVGGLSMGYLGAIDQAFDAGEPNTIVNLMRIRGDLGASSTLGGVYTDRTLSAGGYNRVVGADARLQIGPRNTVSVISAASFTNGAAYAERQTGEFLFARFDRSGRALSFNGEFHDTNADFNAASGFFRRVGDAKLEGNVSYNWFAAPGGSLQSINPSLTVRSFWKHDDLWAADGPEELETQLGWRFQFKDNVSVWGNFTRGMFSYRPEAYEGLLVQQEGGGYVAFKPDQELFGGLDGVTVGLFLNKWERVRGNVSYTVRQTPIFDRSFGVAVEPATDRTGNVMVSLFPTRSLVGELGVNYSQLLRRRDGGEHSSALIPRVRAQYQFSRALFVRGIFEYSAQKTAEFMDPATGLPLYTCDGVDCQPRDGSDGNDFHVEGLVSYEPSPGTVFYVGYSREMEDTGVFAFRDIRSRADGLFVKLSYRFRL